MTGAQSGLPVKHFCTMFKDHKILTGIIVSPYVTRFEIATPETTDLSLAACHKAVRVLLEKLDDLRLSYRFKGDEDVRVREGQFYKVDYEMFCTTHIASVVLVVTVEIDLPCNAGVELLKANGFV